MASANVASVESAMRDAVFWSNVTAIVCVFVFALSLLICIDDAVMVCPSVVCGAFFVITDAPPLLPELPDDGGVYDARVKSTLVDPTLS